MASTRQAQAIENVIQGWMTSPLLVRFAPLIERWITEIVGRREYLEVGQVRDWCDLLVVGHPSGRHVVDSLVIFSPVDTLACGSRKLEAFQRLDDVRRL